MKNLRHIVTIKRPTKAVGPDGQPQGQDETLFSEVPCSIETLTGVESEVGGQLVARSTYQVKLYGDPNKPLKESDYLQFGARRLNISR